MAADELPLFPLNTVLFPGGQLQLRLFEPRYIDLVRRCGRAGDGFGICLIVSGEEVGAPAVPAGTGTEAHIIDFTLTDDGLLAITVEGRRRFRIVSAQVQTDGLQVAEVDWLPEPPVVPVAPEYGLLALLLERILEQVDLPLDPQRQQHLQQADWVAWRLAEWLPLENTERQALLEMATAQERLQALLVRVPDFQAE